MKKLSFLICLVAVGVMGCDDESSDYLEVTVNFLVKNQAGQDLLNSTTSGFFRSEDIRVFSVRNGAREEVYHPNLDAPRSFRIIRNDENGETMFSLDLLIEKQEENPVTRVIQWNNALEDTLVAELKQFNGEEYLETLNKAWLNGKLVYDISLDSGVRWGNTNYLLPNLITLVKE